MMNLKIDVLFLFVFIIIQCIGKLNTLSINEKHVKFDVIDAHTDAIQMMRTLMQNYLAEEEISENIFDLRNNFHEWNEKLIKVNQSMSLESKLLTKTQKLLVAFSRVYENINYYSDDIGLDIKENDEQVIKMFNDLVKYVSDTYKWYDFLISLNTVASSYQVRKNVFSDSHEVFPFSKNCTVYKDSLSLSKSKLFEKLIYKIKYFNFDIDYRDNTEQKPEIMYDNVKDIKINGVKFEHFCRIIRFASHSKTSTKCGSNTMIVKGEFVRMSEISYNKCKNFRSVQVYALNTIYIDSDFEQTGKQLILIAPFIVVKPITMKCVPKYIPCYHLPNLDWLTSVITEKNKTFSNLKTQEDLEKLCFKKGWTIQPKCFTDFYNGAELPSLDLVTEHNYSEIPEKHGGILYGFDKDVKLGSSGYITVNFEWNNSDDQPSLIEIKKLISHQKNSLYDLTKYSQSEQFDSSLLNTITFTDHYIDYQTLLSNYKNYLLRSIDANNDHRKKILYRFNSFLSRSHFVHNDVNALNIAKDLDSLDELYLSKHHEIDFSTIYDHFWYLVHFKFLNHRCVDDCEKLKYHFASYTSTKVLAVNFSSNYVVKNTKEHIADFKNNIELTEDFSASDRLFDLNDELAKYIRTRIQENAFLIRNFIKPKIENIIDELHSRTEKLQIKIRESNSSIQSNLTSSLWQNLLNEKLAFAAHCIILMSEPFGIESVLKNHKDRKISSDGRVQIYSEDYSDLVQALQKVLQTVEKIIKETSEKEKSVFNEIIFNRLKDHSTYTFELFENYFMGNKNKMLNDLRYAELSPDFYLDHGIDENIHYGPKHEIRLNILHRYARKIDTILKYALNSIQERLRRQLDKTILMDFQMDVHSLLWKALMRLNPLFKQLNKSNDLKLLMDEVIEVHESYYQFFVLHNEFWYVERVANSLKKTDSMKEITENTTISKILIKLKEKIQFNIWIRYYKCFLESYKQNIFPFGFAQSVNSLKELNSTNSTEMKRSLLKRVDTFSMSLPRDYTSFEKYLQYKFFHRSKDGAVQPFFVWDNQTYGKDIAKLLAGEIITLRASLARGLNFNAVKFKTVQIKLHSLDSNQDELQKTLSKFVVKLKHLGSSRYKCDDRCYMIRTNSVEYNLSFKNDTVENLTIGSEQLYSDYFSSPYSLWQLELKSAESEKAIFSELSQFKYKVDIDLEGHGMYLDYSGKDVCSNDLKKHYEETFCDIW